ncbi:mitochondrial nucleoid-associated protein 1 isoform X2 [Macrotis lagotis]|uniref:mitochondrial nucleoid-associated protein 1 isoform X2 n=1 Tax=Macrotis lagotis TaxID=92651 RepID=UPI003D6873FB
MERSPGAGRKRMPGKRGKQQQVLGLHGQVLYPLHHGSLINRMESSAVASLFQHLHRRKMADILPHMELCPHCKKQFKRLKSHLPYCKKKEVILPLDSDITDSKAALVQAPKSKELQKKLTKVDGEETHKINQRKRRNTNLVKDRFSANTEMRTNVQTSEDMKKQIEIIPQITQNHPIPKRVVFPTKNVYLLFAAKKTSKARSTIYLPQLGEIKNKKPSENLGSSPSKHSSTNADKKHSSLLNNNRIEHSGQKLLTETLDLPFIIFESYLSLDRCQNPFATLQSNKRSPKARDPISEASHNNSETQKRNTESCFSGNYVNSLYKKFQTGGMENHSIKHRAKKKEFHFGLEAAGKGSWNKGSEGNKSPEVEVPKLDYMEDDLRKQFDNDLATEKTTHHDNPASVLLSSGRLTCKETLSLADLGNQRLSTLVLKYLQEEEDGYKALVIPTNPVENKKSLSSEPDPDPKTWATLTKCHQQPLNLACHCTAKNLISGHVQAAGSKSLPVFWGLEWFPELYPGYLHLGILPERSQKGNIEVQKHHSFTEVERALQVPVWERSLMNIKIGKLRSWFTVPNFSLMGLLGKVLKAWIRYPNYVNLKKGSVGGITMLFAGCWVLCCTWSFKHLSKTSC